MIMLKNKGNWLTSTFNFDMMIFPVEDIIKLDCCDVLASIIDQKKACQLR
jgi:hypothetical protein